MSKVKQYWPEEIVGTGELVVYAQDYTALEAENNALRQQLAELKDARKAAEAIREFEKSGWHGSRGYHAGLLKAAQIVDDLINSGDNRG